MYVSYLVVVYKLMSGIDSEQRFKMKLTESTLRSSTPVRTALTLSKSHHHESQLTYLHTVFEVTSAFGAVGLSLGVPYVSIGHHDAQQSNLSNYSQGDFSLSSSFATLSKLIICVLMIRGRQRGLPLAVDRAVLLPFEFSTLGVHKDERGEVDEDLS